MRAVLGDGGALAKTPAEIDGRAAMRERCRMTMGRPVFIAAVAVLGLAGLCELGFGAMPAASAAEVTPATRAYAQQRPLRLRVTPRRKLGPNAVRQCVAWLAPQYRPSGTVIVPMTRCWWTHGPSARG
jgi:hypothetical protein